MTTVTLQISDLEEKALSTVCASVQEWAENAVKNRARIAIDEIVQICVAKCLENQIPIPSTKLDMVELAISTGWISTVSTNSES